MVAKADRITNIDDLPDEYFTKAIEDIESNSWGDDIIFNNFCDGCPYYIYYPETGPSYSCGGEPACDDCEKLGEFTPSHPDCYNHDNIYNCKEVRERAMEIYEEENYDESWEEDE